MPENQTAEQVPLEAKSPFVLARKPRPKCARMRMREQRSRAGEMGFLHSFTTGSTVDGPGVRVVAWTAGCHLRCLYCHNPDTWNMKNGMPVTVEGATEELRKYRYGLKIMSGGFTISGGEPLMQHRFVRETVQSRAGYGNSHRFRYQRLPG